MGYDKPDLGFVIHYQAPSSIVAYYQQVGRAGRGIESAIGILLSGMEDDDIHQFFRKSAFPSEQQVRQIIDRLEQSDGLTQRQLEEITNLRYGQIEKVLKLLSVENPAPIIKMDSQWRRTLVPFVMDNERIQHLTLQREMEWQEVQRYLQTNQCLMNFLRNALDDEIDEPCGRCAVCVNQAIISTQVNMCLTQQALVFLKQAESPIMPKIQVAANAFEKYGFKGNLPANLKAQEGRVLSRWGDAGWGKMVADDKHAGRFRDELVIAAAAMIKERWQPESFPVWVCCVPSLKHPTLVADFAHRLATELGLPFVNVIKKVKPNEPQKLQQNRFHQCRNLDGAFSIEQPKSGSVLLVDDIIDSGWTFTVIAALLQQAGSGKVYPFALASTSTNE